MLRASLSLTLAVVLLTGFAVADQIHDSPSTVDINLGDESIASKTDDQVSSRPTIRLDGLSPEQQAEIENKKEKLDFQVSIGKIMNLISSPIYPKKEVFLRELISNASDAIDKIRLLSLLEAAALDSTSELSIKIKIDKENKILHIIDTGIGMTREDLIKNLGTIANSGTNEFIKKMSENVSDKATLNDMIGQFGIGFYSSFLVANRVIVTTKHNDDKQYIWESDSQSFSIAEDPRGNTLKRGTQISLMLKDEASEYLEHDTIRNLVKKYSEFIMFPISLWTSKTMKVEEPVEEAASKDSEDEEAASKDSEDEEAQVEDEAETKTKEVEKTVWDWELLNDMKPIWTLKASEVTDDQYTNFYKSLTKDTSPPLAKTHFFAEGEVSFKSLLFIPSVQPSETFNRYGTKSENIKLYVRRVFITSEFSEMLPNYLAFIQGVVDSDDLPLNLSRERLQQHKLLKVIKKKLVRKALDMMVKLGKDQITTFWKEYSTNIKLGVVEDSMNRARLAKILRFYSSNQPEMTTLEEYVSRMKPKQTHIYYLAGSSRNEVENSPFVERLRKKGYEVLYLVEAVDEYCITALPEFDAKKFQNVAKEGFVLPEDKDRHDAAVAAFEPLLKWFNDVGLKNLIAKAAVSERLTDSPCALVASMFGWTGNMERLAISSAHQKTDDPNRAYHLNQRKTLEINPRHPLIKELLRRVQEDPQDPVAKDTAKMLFHTATLRSGFMLKDTAEFANSVELMMRKSLGVSLDEQVEEEDDDEPVDDSTNKDEEDEKEEHDEL